MLSYLSYKFLRVTSSGDTTKIDEYVPAITPTSRTNAKSRVDSPLGMTRFCLVGFGNTQHKNLLRFLRLIPNFLS